MTQSTSTPDPAADEALKARLRQYFACWSADLRAPEDRHKNPLELADALYAPDDDSVYFDLMPPVAHYSWEGFKAGLRNNPHFARVASWKLTPNDDARIFRRGDLAWTTNTFGISAKFKDGTALEAQGRVTVIWEKRGDTWWIVHDHASTPMGG